MMMILMKLFFAKLVYFSGLPYLLRELFQRSQVTILALHDPSLDNARRMFMWLRNRYNIIELGEYLRARQAASGVRLPKRALIITLDDGHAGNYNLLPLIREERIPVTIFLCSGIIDTRRHYWFKYAGLKYPSSYYKKLPDGDRLKELMDCGFEQDKNFDFPQALDRKQIEEMREYVDFQSHTVFHPCLDQCDDNKSSSEIVESRRMLEDDYGFKVNAIAFPNGNYGSRELSYASAAGYSCALTCDYGFNDLRSDPFRLKRLSINDNDPIELVALKSCGLWGFFKWLTGSGKHVQIKTGSNRLDPGHSLINPINKAKQMV